MIVYGDAERQELPAHLIETISARICACIRMPAGQARHETLVSAFICTAELVQGVADLEFERCGADDVSQPQEAGSRLLLALASAMDRSWRQCFHGEIDLPCDWPQMLARLAIESPITTKQSE